MKNTLVFISVKHSPVIEEITRWHFYQKMALADYAIRNNIYVKSRTCKEGVFVSNDEVIQMMKSGKWIVMAIDYPDKISQDKQASQEFIQSQIKRYLDNQNNVADPIIDRISLELRGLYPKLSKEQSVDWALEFINTDYSCEEIFKRMDASFLPTNTENKFDKYFNS